MTALKRSTLLASFPGTLSVVNGRDLRSASGLPGSDAIGRQVPSLTISSLGAGLNRLFLRGIGDGPLNGFNQGSVAVLLDEARINYDAPDPDWALIDIKQIEVLEGPQGPLYGTGALGGIVKISHESAPISRAFGSSLLFSRHDPGPGGISNSQSAVLNLPLSAGRFGIRAVGYRDQRPGWIDNVGGRQNVNRLRARRQPRGISMAAFRQLDRRSRWCSSKPHNARQPICRRRRWSFAPSGPSSEPRDLDARLGTLTVRETLFGLDITSISGVSRQETAATYDATPLVANLGTSGTTAIEDDRNYSVLDQEVRIQSRSASGIQWLAGLSFFHQRHDEHGHFRDRYVLEYKLADLPQVDQRGRSAFGETSISLARDLTLGGGARIFSVGIDDEGQQSQSTGTLNRKSIRAAGDASLTWTPMKGETFFLHAASGYRPGGINVQTDATQPTYDADELTSVELGSRVKLGNNLSAESTLFASSWRHVQTDELLLNGLIATRNAG